MSMRTVAAAPTPGAATSPATRRSPLRAGRPPASTPSGSRRPPAMRPPGVSTAMWRPSGDQRTRLYGARIHTRVPRNQNTRRASRRRDDSQRTERSAVHDVAARRVTSRDSRRVPGRCGAHTVHATSRRPSARLMNARVCRQAKAWGCSTARSSCRRTSACRLSDQARRSCWGRDFGRYSPTPSSGRPVGRETLRAPSLRRVSASSFRSSVA